MVLEFGIPLAQLIAETRRCRAKLRQERHEVQLRLGERRALLCDYNRTAMEWTVDIAKRAQEAGG